MIHIHLMFLLYSWIIIKHMHCGIKPKHRQDPFSTFTVAASNKHQNTTQNNFPIFAADLAAAEGNTLQ